MSALLGFLIFGAGMCAGALALAILMRIARSETKIEYRWAVLDSRNLPVELTKEQYDALAPAWFAHTKHEVGR